MDRSIAITALQYFRYEDRDVAPGDVLLVRPVEAASFKYRGLAKLGGAQPVASVAEVHAAIEHPTPSESPRRRRYRRRDVATSPQHADLTADE